MLCLMAFGQKKPSSNAAVPQILREEYSSVYDIRNFEKFYVVIFSPDSKKLTAAIEKVLSKKWSIKPADSSEAQFIVIYTELKEVSEMKVYYTKDKKIMIVVWAEKRDAKGRETELTEAFLKVLQRNKKLDDQDKPVADAR